MHTQTSKHKLQRARATRARRVGLEEGGTARGLETLYDFNSHALPTTTSTNP